MTSFRVTITMHRFSPFLFPQARLRPRLLVRLLFLCSFVSGFVFDSVPVVL